MSGLLPPLSLIVFLANIYCLIWVYRGLKMITAKPLLNNNPQQSFSIIIAARNEAGKIEKCLRVLAGQDYPKDKYEIIIVADRCSDETVQIASQFKDEFTRLKIFEIQGVPNGISPKKYAIAKGIEEASFDRLIFLDADVVPTPNYIHTMNQYFDGDAIVAIMKLNLHQDFLQEFLKYERLLNWSVAAGSIGNGNPMISYGGNWGYTHNAFEKVNGFQGIFKSLGGDDDLLLQKFGRKKLEVRFCSDPDGWVSTDAPDSFGKFLRQRRRHFAAGKYYQTKFKLAYFIYHTSNAAIWIMPFIYPLSTFLLLLKIIGNTVLLKKSREIFKEKLSLSYVPIFEILFMIYSVFMGMFGFLGRIKWR